MADRFLLSAKNQFDYYKVLGDKALAQLKDQELFWRPNQASNSIAILIRHMSGNMLSRWTDFLNTDGEKEWRDRDAEFECDESISRTELINEWERGWQILYSALDNLKEEDFQKTIFIRNEPQLVVQAINRALAHYCYHVGQIVYIGKQLKGDQWNTLTIPKGKSKEYNNSYRAKQK